MCPVEVLSCSVAQPTCGGKKSNAGKKVASNTKVGTVSAPNLDGVSASFNNSATSGSGAASAATSVPALGALAVSVLSAVVGTYLSL